MWHTQIGQDGPIPADKELPCSPTTWWATHSGSSLLTYPYVPQLSRRVALLLIIEKLLNRGVIWDQEIYDNFAYNQDRTFFYSFELEDCMAALSFADDKEAKQFKKKMDEREKNASK